jgi:hypothetical protein
MMVRNTPPQASRRRLAWGTRFFLASEQSRPAADPYLGQDLINYVTRDVGETEVASLEFEGELGVVYT